MEKASAQTESQDRATEGTALPERLLTIGDMASIYGLTLRALRFYEDRGLVAPIRHGVSRFYDARARARVDTILRGKKLGFTLQQIAELISKQADTPGCPRLALGEAQVLSQITQLERKRSDLDAAIRELRDVHHQMTGGATDTASAA
jgi:DNA-binding transcriptional MerR regulator